MYKLLVFFVFFSILLNAQTVPEVRNQNNSPEIQRESLEKKQTQSLSRKSAKVQLKSFEINVNEIQSELKLISNSSVRKSPTLFQQQQMQLRLNEIAQINKQSFEYHLLNYQVGNYDFSRINNLKSAELLKPNDITVLKELSAYSYIMDNNTQLLKYLKRLNTMRAFSTDLELYARNVLLSLPSNYVFVSHGEQDTYPLLIQQKINNVRNDVEIISLDHLQSKDYRKRLKKQGFNIPKGDVIDTQFFDEFMKLNSNRKIVVAASVPRPYLEKVERLQYTGLGFVVGSANTKSSDNNLQLFQNELKSKIIHHINVSKNGGLLGNYLPYLFDIRNSYIDKKDWQSIEEIDQLIMIIGQKSNKAERVKFLLNK